MTATKKVFSSIFVSFIILASILFSIQAVSAAPLPATLNPNTVLRTAGNFVILAKTGISTTGTTSIVGDIGVSPAAASFITGFALIADASNHFSKSSLITGNVYASNYAPPTPAIMTTAIGDMQQAYTDAAAEAAGTATGVDLNVGAGTLSDNTFAPGVYTWNTPGNVVITNDITLSGSSTDVWVFQISGNLDIASGKHIILSGGAQASNIFWQVAGQTTLGTGSVFEGNILDQTAIVLNTGATLYGKALAQSAVTLDANGINTAAALVADTTPPTLTAVAHDETAKTITLTWNEPVHFETEHGNNITAVSPAILNIFVSTVSGDYDLTTIAPGVNITATSFDATNTILTITYTGSLVDGTPYVVDSWVVDPTGLGNGGYDIKDASGNTDQYGTAPDVSPVFTATNPSSTPASQNNGGGGTICVNCHADFTSPTTSAPIATTTTPPSTPAATVTQTPSTPSTGGGITGGVTGAGTNKTGIVLFVLFLGLIVAIVVVLIVKFAAGKK